MGSSRANRAQRIGCLRERDLHTAHSRFVEFQQQDLHPSTKMTNSATCERASVGAYRAITLELEFQLQGVRLSTRVDSSRLSRVESSPRLFARQSTVDSSRLESTRVESFTARVREASRWALFAYKDTNKSIFSRCTVGGLVMKLHRVGKKERGSVGVLESHPPTQERQ